MPYQVVTDTSMWQTRTDGQTEHKRTDRTQNSHSNTACQLCWCVIRISFMKHFPLKYLQFFSLVIFVWRSDGWKLISVIAQKQNLQETQFVYKTCIQIIKSQKQGRKLKIINTQLKECDWKPWCKLTVQCSHLSIRCTVRVRLGQQTVHFVNPGWMQFSIQYNPPRGTAASW